MPFNPFPIQKWFQHLRLSFSQLKTKGPSHSTGRVSASIFQKLRAASPAAASSRHHSSRTPCLRPCLVNVRVLLSLITLLMMAVIYVEHWTKCFLLRVPLSDPARGETVTALSEHPGVQGALLVFLIRVLPCQFRE